ncbi:uncharacterized protein LOC143605492 [Bidens hawaiensis]|uniref:uncharacterized protein LOC143605492 n=1 Tax=Bidens hawaiensis TaxID=980011 RepID=UPI004049D1B8
MKTSHDFVDGIKAEKANALARYRMFSNITKLFQLIELFVAVTLISWSSTQLPLVIKFSSEYVLAYSSYFTNQHVVFVLGNVIVVVCYMLSRDPDSSKIVLESGSQNDVVKYISNDLTTSCHKPVIGNEEKEIKRFQRTKSDKLNRRMPVKELRRSVTEMRRSEDSMKAVENLSNEEFRIAVETFIKKQQRLLKEQSMDEEDS